MMRADVKRLSEAEIIGPTDRQTAAIDRALLSRARVRKQLEAAAVDGERAWFAIRVRVNCEKAVDKALWMAGVSTWLPLERIEGLVRRGRRLPVQERPVLWGLLFVHIVMSADAWHGLRSVKHVISIIGDEHGPMPILNKQFNSFRTMVDLGVYGEKPTGWTVGVGDTVKVGAGPAYGKKGVVKAIKGKRHDRIMLMLWGGKNVIDIPLAHLVKPD
ncbi:transcription termination/antitermination NusG family protein [Mesorhizobium sp. M0768]|uniref:transcription termination/antitermination protein NusG n=1 Tax=Mesorhizobium sp. M0768 TaxID=2956996 RepID=UPI00333DF5EB